MQPSAIEADYLVDRRRLRRRVTLWRSLAFAVAALAVAALGWRANGGFGGQHLTSHIARIAIKGLIVGDDETLKLIRKAGETSSATALILAIDSPGGTTTGSEKVYEEIRRVAAKKPVVAVVGTLAASGAYIAALGSDEIFASGNSLVGSIGVLFQFPNVSKLLDTVGVKMEEVKSSPLKAAPNGYEPTSDAARAALAALVDDSFAWFKGLVKDRRHMSDAELAAVADGRVFTARMGLPLKLVDQLGGEREAIAWLETEKKIARDLPVTTYKPDEGLGRFGVLSLAAKVSDMAGMQHIAQILRREEAATEIHALDGLVSIWQGTQH